MPARRKILMACGHHWRSDLHLGSHHLARGFVRAGWEVGFVSYPLTLLRPRIGAGRDIRERAAVHRAGGERHLDGRLWSYVPGAWLAPGTRPLLRSERVCRHWASLTRPDLVATIVANGFGDADLLYIDNVSHAFWPRAIRRRCSLYRVADRNMGLSRATPAMGRIEAELARSVDLVLYAAESLESYVREMHPRRMAHLPNGVDFERFARGSKTAPPEYRDIPRPIAVYVGAMEAWFDYALVNEAAARLPDVSFVLIGPDALARRRLPPRANVHILGGRPHHGLPPYLHNADVGLIPFDVAGYPELVHAVNPLKLYEYLACGLPVVSVAWDELRRLRSPAILCDTTKQFVAGIERVLACRPPAGPLVRYAEDQDWSRRVEAIVRLVDEAA